MIIRVKSYGLCAGQEGVQAHGRLCSLLEQGDAVLMGNPAAWIPKVAHPSRWQPESRRKSLPSARHHASRYLCLGFRV